MCSGAIFWSGIGRVVYGLSETGLLSLSGDHPGNPTLDHPCRLVLAAGGRPIDVIGPLLEQEAAVPHTGLDRKSTRLNSSHVASSYAVFCLKKKRNRLSQHRS